MDFVLQSLLWKEWRERKGILFVCLAWILCGLVYVVLSEFTWQENNPVFRFSRVCFLYSMFMTIFLAMRVCLSEVTNQTLLFSSTLPVALSRIAAVKLIVAVITLVGPILVGALILAVLLACGILEQTPVKALDLSEFSLLGRVTCIAVAQSSTLFLVLAVVGARCRLEVHAGLWGAVVSILWVTMGGSFQSWGSPQIRSWLSAVFPQILAMCYSFEAFFVRTNDLAQVNQVWIPLGFNLLVLVGLGYWFTRRYGIEKSSVSHQKVNYWNWDRLFSWISIPFPGKNSSFIWINLRQSIPLASAGLALACSLALMSVLSSTLVSGFTISGRVLVKTADTLPATMSLIALLWGAVVAAGIFAAELRPGLGHFWMSRPIPVNRWFWWKYLVGLFAVLMVLDGTAIAVSWSSIDDSFPRPTYFSSNLLSWSYIACFPLLHAMMYSLSVLSVCWWKKPVQGAVCAILFYLIGIYTMELILSVSILSPSRVFDNLFQAEREGDFNLANHYFPLVYGTIIVITIFTAYLASRKVKRLEV